jgi:hypothetical protein
MGKFRKELASLSIVASLMLAPSLVYAEGTGGFASGSSESVSALLEPANVEKQLVRINDGINLIRLNNIIINKMPISPEAKWVDETVQDLNPEIKTKVESMKHVQTDPYLSTVKLTNEILGIPTITQLSPVAYVFHNRLSAVYDRMPDLYAMPSITSMNSYIEFGGNGKLKTKIEASKGNRYDNATAAVMALLPKSYNKTLKNQFKTFENKQAEYLKIESDIGKLEAWLDDDKNVNNPKRAKQEEQLKIKKEEAKLAEKAVDEAEEIYFTTLENAALEIESNFDRKSVPLARKLDKLFATVDANAVGAISLFGVATGHIIKNSIGTLSQELDALRIAKQNLSVNTVQNNLMIIGNNAKVTINVNDKSKLVAQQQAALNLRATILAKNALFALPNIAIGSYYATKQIRFAGKYQGIVGKVLEIAEAEEEAAKLAEAEKVADAS